MNDFEKTIMTKHIESRDNISAELMEKFAEHFWSDYTSYALRGSPLAKRLYKKIAKSQLERDMYTELFMRDMNLA